jgi:two-component system LytT family response regulator
MPRRKWRVLIADDEPAARRGVRQLLAPYADFEVVGECRDGREVLESIDRVAPDVVFLDIQMPELDGFDVIRQRTPDRMPAVVFLTAYDRYALRGFEAEALDYLVKPVSDARFAATMRRVSKRLDPLMPRADRSLVVTTTRGTLVLSLADVDWIEAADYYARVWIGARSYLLRESLTQLERRVGEAGFVRTHRQALVRLSAIRALRAGESGDLVAVLSTGATIPVARRRRASLAAALRELGRA